MVTGSQVRSCAREELERIARGEQVPAETETAMTAASDPSEPVYCAETGAAVSRREAVCEKLRLYPLAQTNEIVASFARDGISVSWALVQRLRDELWLARGRSESCGTFRSS